MTINYLKISGFNAYSKENLSNSDKIKWVDNNIDNILNFEELELWKDAYSPLEFIKFCIEFNNYYDAIN